MKKIIITFIILISIHLYCDLVDVWEQDLGGSYSDRGRALIKAIDGGFILAGDTRSYDSENGDILIIKLDENGSQLWQSIIGTDGFDHVTSICKAVENDGYVICGYTNNAQTQLTDYYLAKVNLDGDLQWSRTYGGVSWDEANSISTHSENGYLICGNSQSFGLGEADIYLIKTDAVGGIVWTRTFGTSHSEQGNCVIETSDGNYLLAGATGMFDTPGVATGRNRDHYLVKVSPDGEMLGFNTYWIIDNDQGDCDHGFSVCETSEGNYCFIGSTTAEGVEVLDVGVVMVDSDLQVIWKEHYEIGGFYDFGRSVNVTDDGNIIIGGSCRFSDLKTDDLFLLCLDSTGDELWRYIDGSEYSEALYDLYINNGEIYVLGQSAEGENGGYDFYCRKFAELKVDFEQSQSCGHAPLEIQFESICSDNVDFWQWDFDSDGIIDSEEENPHWVYNEPGEYSITLRAGYDDIVLDVTKESEVEVFDGESALKFENNDDKAVILIDGNLGLSSAFTFEAWINPSDWGANSSVGMGRIVDKGAFSLYLMNSSNQSQCLGLWLFFADGSNSMITSDNFVLELDQWQHVGFSYNPSANDLALYVNGSQVGYTLTQPLSGDLADHTENQLTLGNKENCSNAFRGRIDEVRIWECVIGSCIINQNYDEYLTGNEDGLTGYWQFNEGNGLLFNGYSIDMSVGEIVSGDWGQGVHLDENGVEEDEIVPLDVNLRCYPNPFKRSGNSLTIFTEPI